MVTSHVWDRASLPVVRDGRRMAQVAALPVGLPTLDGLFDFMRDAELRFATLRMRVVETTITAGGPESWQSDVMLRHAGDARVTVSRPGDLLRAGPGTLHDGQVVVGREEREDEAENDAASFRAAWLFFDESTTVHTSTGKTAKACQQWCHG